MGCTFSGRSRQRTPSPSSPPRSPLSLLQSLRGGTDTLQGTATLVASVGTGARKVAVEGAASTDPVASKDQDRFILKTLSSSAVLAGIFDGHSVHRKMQRKPTSHVAHSQP